MTCALAGLLPALTAQPVLAAEPEPKPAPWKGFYLKSDDGAFSLRLQTQLQIDGVGFPGDEAGANVDDIRIRRLRPAFRATVFRDFALRWVMDFAESRASVQDAIIELTHLEALSLRVGKDKAPNSYDHLHSSSALAFLERGTTARLSGNRDLGVQLFGVIDKGLVDYQLGVFDGVVDSGSLDVDTDDRFEVAGRVTLKPFHAIEPLAELALGVTASYGEALGTSTTATNVPSYRTSGRATWFRYAAGADLATTVVADGTRMRLGGHLDWRVGPLSLFGEVLMASQELRLGDVTGEVSNLAWQAYAAFVLFGGDARRAGVEPRAPFDPDTGGAGALELAVRYGELSIDAAAFDLGFADATRSASRLSSFTVGLNWYLNRVIKLQLDYERSMFEGGAATGDRAAEDLLGARLQAAF